MYEISVVIPTYNRVDMLERVLDSLHHQANPPAFEVVVVNDGSTDGTSERVEKGVSEGRWTFPFRFESQKNAGPGKARNRGVALATGRYVIFIGDDTVPEEEFLAEHFRVHEDQGHNRLVACLGYTGWPAEQPATAFMDYINDYGLQFGYKLIEHGTVVPFNFFYTSNISIDRELLAAHPFDTSFPAAAWEDIELAFRLEQKGLQIHYNRNAVTRHHHPMTIRSFARRQYAVGKSGAIFYRKHPELAHFLGVVELEQGGLEGEGTVRRLDWLARLGERYRPFARPRVFERLMRQHYLRGLRDGLSLSPAQVE